jgi:hypothetical protein
MRSLSTHGWAASQSVTAVTSFMTLPSQSREISAVNPCPKPVEPCGFGKATT